MKHQKDRWDLIILLVIVTVVIVLTILGFGFAYWISVSDLPDWFKFWLLNE